MISPGKSLVIKISGADVALFNVEGNIYAIGVFMRSRRSVAGGRKAGRQKYCDLSCDIFLIRCDDGGRLRLVGLELPLTP